METAKLTLKRAGRPRAADLAQRADDLLSVAEEALIQWGYERATLDLISKKAGVSKQTIYAKYGGKPQLIQAVLQRMGDQVPGAAFDDDDDLPLYEGLFQRARAILQLNQSEGAIAVTRISLCETQRFPEFRNAMLEAKRIRQEEPLSRYLQRFQQRGEITDVDCGAVASLFLWMLAEDMINAVATGVSLKRSADEMNHKADFVTRLIMKGISTEGPQTRGSSPAS